MNAISQMQFLNLPINFLKIFLKQAQRAKALIILLNMFFLFSCSTTKKVQEGDRLLVKNKIFVNGKGSFFNTDITEYLYQKPNRKFLFLPFSLYAYNMIKSDYDSILQVWENTLPKNAKIKREFLKKNGLKKFKFNFNNWLYHIGTPPVIVDSSSIRNSEVNLKKHFFNRGFFDAELRHKSHFKNKKGKIYYHIETKAAYFIDSINTNIETPSLDSIYGENKEKSYLKKGQQYLQKNFSDERQRLVKLFRNKGFYKFTPQYIRYEVDTNGLKNKLHIAQFIQDPVIKIKDTTQNKDTIYTKNHHLPYFFKRINVFYTSPDEKPGKYSFIENYKNYFIYSAGASDFSSRTYSNAILFKQGDIYSDESIKKTYFRLNRLNNFQSNIQIKEDSLQRGALIANLFLKPLKKHNILFELDNYISSFYGFGILTKLGYTTRNIFGGGENLDISGQLSLGTVKTGNSSRNNFFNAREISAEAKIYFPRFLIPFFNTDNFLSKEINKQTTSSFLFSSQNNIGLGKLRFSGIMAYKWNKRITINHQLNLFNIQYIFNSSKDQYFNLFPNDLAIQNNLIEDYISDRPNYRVISDEQTLRDIPSDSDYIENSSNRGLFNNYLDMDFRRNRIISDYLFTFLSYTFTFNQRLNQEIKNPVFVEARAETSGNVLNLLSNFIDFKEGNSGERLVFGVPYAQYVKFDLDVRKYYNFRRGSELAFRFLTGVTFPYGNNFNIPVPFDKSYLAGGTNDIRAWRAYELGPGSSTLSNRFSVEALKLTANVEYRFNVYNDLKGALFVDAGNIWAIRKYEDRFNFLFRLDSFYKELGIGYGFGLRYDFGFFKLRLDAAWKMHDPSKPIGDRWVIDQTKFIRDVVLNFGINYPF